MLIDQEKLKKDIQSSVDSFSEELKHIRSGKANPSDIEGIKVEAYEVMNSLNTVAQVIAEDAMNLKVVVWDKGILANVDKALREGEIGGSIAIDKDVIRIKFTPMTEEDRVRRVKDINHMTEDYRVRVRQVRQKYMKQIEDLGTEDDQERDKKELQTMIDESIKQLEELAKKKESELLSL